MWWAKSEPVAQAWVSQRCFAWHGAAGTSSQAIEQEQEAAALLQTHIQAEAPRAVRIWLSGALCRLERIPAIVGPRNQAEAQMAAAAVLHTRAALLPGEQVLLPYWPYALPHWCVAVVDPVLQQQLEAAAGKALQSIKPWWAWALKDAQAGNAGTDAEARSNEPPQDLAWALFDGEALVTARVDGTGSITEAATLMPVADRTTAQRIINRRTASGAPGLLRCLSLELPPGLNQVPDAATEVVSDFAFARYVRAGDAL